MSIAYLDLNCGIAGDMFLAALLDAGCDRDALEGTLEQLPIAGEFSLHLSRVRRGALMGTHLDVQVEAARRHEHGRSYSLIVRMLQESDLPQRVRADSTAVFTEIGKVEAYLHGVSIDEIHFHEVGAVDSIVDIVGVCAALDLLQVDQLYSSPVTDGYGTLNCAHGILPVPAPATLELLKGAPLLSCEIPYELVTPTGAGLLRHFCKGYGLRPPMIVRSVGYGAGTRDLPQRANLLRITLGDPIPAGEDLHPDSHLPHSHDHGSHDHTHHDHDPHDHSHHHDHTHHEHGSDDHSHHDHGSRDHSHHGHGRHEHSHEDHSDYDDARADEAHHDH